MVSSRDVLVLVRAALGFCALASCSVGHGKGEIHGTLMVEGCRAEPDYELDPSAFFAQKVDKLLRIRVQRGSDLEVRSDGLAVLVEDAPRVKREFLGTALDVAPGSDPRIDASVFLNESCPPGRTKTPVALSAVSGTITFDDIYAPQVDDNEVRIRAELDDVRFEDPRNPARWAELSGYFDFLYVRGSPAQRFP